MTSRPWRAYSEFQWPESESEKTMKRNRYPAGWNKKRVERVLAHYEAQTEEEAVAEDEAAYETAGQTTMTIPTELVPKVRELLAKHRAA